MSGLMKNSDPKEVTSLNSMSSAWIPDVFDCYQVPLEIGQGIVDPVDEHIRYKCQMRHLGPAYLKCGHFSAIQVNFYEVIRSEISEVNKVKRHSHSSSSMIGGADAHSYTRDIGGGGTDLSLCEDAEPLPCPSETTHNPLLGSNPSSATDGVPSLTLPPKKRLKRTVVQHCVVFSLTKDHQVHQDLSFLSSSCTYYLFPQNSLMDVVNDMAPFQIFCTFHLSKPSPMVQNTRTFYNTGSSLSPSSRINYRTKLEEFAAVCDSSHHDQAQSQLVDPRPFALHSHSVNVEISGASGDAYYSLRQSVSGYQASCQRMADLLHLHNQRATTYKTEFSLYPDQFLPSNQQPISSKTQNQVTDYHPPGKTNDKPTVLSSSPQDQQHDYIDQQQITSSIEELYENSNKNKMWSHGKKRHSTGGPDDKIESFDKDYVPPSPTKKKKPKRNSSSRSKESSQGIRKCIYCNVTSTPMWRRGPEGAGTLCNACGVKWKHGKILSSNATSQQTNGSSTTDIDEDDTCNKRKKSTAWIKQEKKIKTTTTTTNANRMTNDTASTNSDASIDLRLHEDRHCESGTTNDRHHHHRQTFISTNHDNNGATNPSSSKTSTSRAATPMINGDSHLHSSTSSTLSSQHSIILSSESIYNSPLTSFTSTPNSSPPLSMDSQQHRGILALSFTEKLGHLDSNDTLPLATGVDDVEAAAVLTLLRRS